MRLITTNYLPFGSTKASEGIFEANANNTMQYIAVITLSAATPAAKTDGETPSASEIAM